MPLPTWLFVTRNKDRDGSDWLECHEDQVEAVENATYQNDTTVIAVGTYKLIKTNKLSVVKTVKFHSRKKS